MSNELLKHFEILAKHPIQQRFIWKFFDQYYVLDSSM